jgi:DNA integrity scanning protein DisA with diadenylate cyclase activity
VEFGMTSLGLRWQSIVDFVVLVAAIYFVLRWSREARALRVTLGILALEAGALIVRQVHLTITVWVLHAGTLVAAVILIVLFQPELRHAVLQGHRPAAWSGARRDLSTARHGKAGQDARHRSAFERAPLIGEDNNDGTFKTGAVRSSVIGGLLGGPAIRS